MPNWCCNEEIIYGPKEEIENLYKKLKEWTSKNYMKNGFGEEWLGNIVLGAGFDCYKLNCRGEITYDFVITVDETNAMIEFSSQTAWSDVHETWYKILEKHAPNCEYYFQSEETGSQYFVTNDKDKKFFDEGYFLDVAIDNKDSFPKDLEHLVNYGSYFSEKEMLTFLQDFLKKNDEDLNSLITEFNKESDEGKFGEGNLLRIYPFEVVV